LCRDASTGGTHPGPPFAYRQAPRRLRTMSTLFAFLHHVAAFTLVSALAVEFVLIRQDLTLANARKLPVVDAVLGVAAGLLLIIGRCACSISRRARPTTFRVMPF